MPKSEPESQDEDTLDSSEVNRFHAILGCAELNGLFDKDTGGLDDKMKQNLRAAGDLLNKQPSDVAGAWVEIHNFYTNMRTAEKQRGLFWRLNMKYGLFAWVYLVISPFLFDIVQRRAFSGAPVLFRDALFWGLIGGILQGFYYTYQSLSSREFEDSWAFWVLSLPVAGALFGGIAYLLILGGLIPLVSTTTSGSNAFFVSLAAALAGFNWKGVVESMKASWAKITKGS